MVPKPLLYYLSQMLKQKSHIIKKKPCILQMALWIAPIKPMDLCDFASEIVDGLVEIWRALVSSQPVKPPIRRPKKKPVGVVRKDGTNHLP